MEEEIDPKYMRLWYFLLAFQNNPEIEREDLSDCDLEVAEDHDLIKNQHGNLRLTEKGEKFLNPGEPNDFYQIGEEIEFPSGYGLVWKTMMKEGAW